MSFRPLFLVGKTMNENLGAKPEFDEIEKKVVSRFLLIQREPLLAPLVEVSLDDAEAHDCLRNAVSGLDRVISAASLPFTMTHNAVMDRHYQRLFTHERILQLIPAYDSPEGKYDEKWDRIATEKANAEMDKLLQDQTKLLALKNEIITDLHRSLASFDVRVAAEELLAQSIISTWSVFEGFSRNFITLLLNRYPQAAYRVMLNPEMKDFIGKPAIDINTLEEHQFDVSSSMGTILFRNRRFDSFSVIKTLYKCMFDDASVQGALGHHLWMLNQMRHLFVHSRGLIDQEFINQTGTEFPIGSKLPLNSCTVEEGLRATTEAIRAICVKANSLS